MRFSCKWIGLEKTSQGVFSHFPEMFFLIFRHKKINTIFISLYGRIICYVNGTKIHSVEPQRFGREYGTVGRNKSPKEREIE